MSSLLRGVISHAVAALIGAGICAFVVLVGIDIDSYDTRDAERDAALRDANEYVNYHFRRSREAARRATERAQSAERALAATADALERSQAEQQEIGRALRDSAKISGEIAGGFERNDTTLRALAGTIERGRNVIRRLRERSDPDN